MEHASTNVIKRISRCFLFKPSWTYLVCFRVLATDVWAPPDAYRKLGWRIVSFVTFLTVTVCETLKPLRVHSLENFDDRIEEQQFTKRCALALEPRSTHRSTQFQRQKKHENLHTWSFESLTCSKKLSSCFCCAPYMKGNALRAALLSTAEARYSQRAHKIMEGAVPKRRLMPHIGLFWHWREVFWKHSHVQGPTFFYYSFVFSFSHTLVAPSAWCW